MKSGPNGHALVYAAHDLVALFKEEKLISAILSLNNLLGNSWKNQMIKANILKENKDQNLIHSRLGFSPEGGGKTRIFAIGDY
jgi:hypothetical protein